MTRETAEFHVTQELAAYANGTLDLPTRARVRGHLGACEACRSELASWKAIAKALQFDLAQAPIPARAVLDAVLARIESTESRTYKTPWNERMVTMVRTEGQRFMRPLIGVAVAAGLVGALFLTPLGSYADDFLTIFTPKQFVAVPLTESDLSSLPDLSDYGTMTTTSAYQTPVHAETAQAASEASGMSVRVPASLAPGVQNAPSYNVMPSGHSAVFTFSAEKAQAAAAAKGQQLPPMPANIDGSSIQALMGAVVVASYPPADNAELPIPTLMIGQTTTPVVQSTGVSVDELKQYLLAQPGISPQLAQAIRDLGDPATTLLIPIPLNLAASHPVQVQGVRGLAIADSTNFGSGIIWEKDGFIYGVAGTLSESELLVIANSLQ